MSNKLEELPIHGKVQEVWLAVTAILGQPGLRKNSHLREQIEDANDSMDANMREGFEQPTDAAFGNFVFTAKGSLAEVVARLEEAHAKKLVSQEDLAHIKQLAEPLGKMMGGFIKYLYASGFTDRGRHSVAPTAPKPLKPRRNRRR